MPVALQVPPPVPQQGFQSFKDAEDFARALVQYLDVLRQKVSKALP